MILNIFKRKFVADVEGIYASIYRDATSGHADLGGWTRCKSQVLNRLTNWLCEEKAALDGKQYTSMAEVGDSVHRVKVWAGLHQVHELLESGGHAAPRGVIATLYRPATEMSDRYFGHLQLHDSTPLSRALAGFSDQPLELARQLYSREKQSHGAGMRFDESHGDNVTGGSRPGDPPQDSMYGFNNIGPGELETLEELISRHLAAWESIQDLEATLASAQRPVPIRAPYWAIVYGIVDSLGQSVRAGIHEALIVLDLYYRKRPDGVASLSKVLAASKTPDLRNWLVDAGAATHSIRTMTASPTEALMPLARRYRKWTEAHPE